MDSVITVENLHKAYGSNIAVDNVSLDVRRGEIFGIIGPNGAGKTTMVESMAGLRLPDRGRVSILGLDPTLDRTELGQRIGIQLQQANLNDRIKVWEALDLFSSFYDITVPWEPLLKKWGLTEKRNSMFVNLSGGQKQRLFIALALLNDPEIVFLDELTTGLDPQARRETWDLVRQIRDQGKTVVLVTHYMDEVELLCDRVAIIDQGRIVAKNTPQGLIDQVGGDSRITFTAPSTVDLNPIKALPQVTSLTRAADRVTVVGKEPLLAPIVVTLAEYAFTPTNIKTETVDFEDVFIALTGREIRG